MKTLRIILFAFILAAFYLFHLNHCFMFNNTPLPFTQQMNGQAQLKEIVMLFGQMPCGQCSSGLLLESLNNNPNVLVVVAENYSNVDMQNLRNAYGLKNIIINADASMIDFAKKMSRCKKFPRWDLHYHVILDKKMKIEVVKKI